MAQRSRQGKNGMYIIIFIRLLHEFEDYNLILR